jgi:hypothetical protein
VIIPHILVGFICDHNIQNGYILFLWGNLRERDHCGDPGIDGRIILRRIFRKWYVGVWTGLGWHWIEMDGRHLWMW